jgi:uncharacterized protein YxjI
MSEGRDLAVAPVTVACACGEVYDLKPEYAGVLLECPSCGRHLRAAGRPVSPAASVSAGDAAFDRDVFLLRERVFTIASKYEVRTEDGTPILYVERPTYLIRTLGAYLLGVVAASIVFSWTAREDVFDAMNALLGLFGFGFAFATFVVVSMSARPLRHVTVYRDDSRREVLLRVLQDQRVAVLVRTYTVRLGDGTMLARLRKNYLYNLIRKRWIIEDPSGAPVAHVVEESIVLSLLRRVLGPFFGLLRTNFVFERPGGQTLGEFNRRFTLVDRYVLDLRDDPGRTLDRRVALATGIMLDTGERR